MTTNKQIKWVIIVIIILFIFTIYRAINIRNFYMKETKEYYECLDLEQYSNQPITSELRKKIMEDKTLNDALNSYLTIDDTLPIQAQAYNAFNNIIYTSNLSKNLEETTQEEQEKYMNNQTQPYAKVKKEILEEAAREVFGENCLETFLKEQLENIAIYDKGYYYIFLSNDKSSVDSGVSYPVRLLKSIEKEGENLVLSFNKYEIYSLSESEVNNMQKAIIDGDEEKILNNILISNSIYKFEVEKVKLKENPNGKYAKYIIEKKDNSIINVITKENVDDLILAKVTVLSKEDSNTYLAQLKDVSIRIIIGEEDITCYKDNEIYIKSEKQNFTIGKEVYLEGTIEIYKEKILLNEKIDQ